MKVASSTAFVVAMLSCASAFGLNGADRSTATSVMRSVGLARHSKPMVQAIDIQGNRLSAPTASAMVSHVRY